jgi:hypothetical protein
MPPFRAAPRLALSLDQASHDVLPCPWPQTLAPRVSEKTTVPSAGQARPSAALFRPLPTRPAPLAGAGLPDPATPPSGRIAPFATRSLPAPLLLASSSRKCNNEAGTRAWKSAEHKSFSDAQTSSRCTASAKLHRSSPKWPKLRDTMSGDMPSKIPASSDNSTPTIAAQSAGPKLARATIVPPTHPRHPAGPFAVAPCRAGLRQMAMPSLAADKARAKADLATAMTWRGKSRQAHVSGQPRRCPSGGGRRATETPSKRRRHRQLETATDAPPRQPPFSFFRPSSCGVLPHLEPLTEKAGAMGGGGGQKRAQGVRTRPQARLRRAWQNRVRAGPRGIAPGTAYGA